ncbi:hypothetical protein CRYUN_Cryun01aG0018700 [Craigia yunnanensis]
MQILRFLHSRGSELGLEEIKKHLDSVLFKEAGAITGVFCNQYISADEEIKSLVESYMGLLSGCLLWSPADFSSKQKMEYEWSKDEVQTARILFYVRV